MEDQGDNQESNKKRMNIHDNQKSNKKRISIRDLETQRLSRLPNLQRERDRDLPTPSLPSRPPLPPAQQQQRRIRRLSEQLQALLSHPPPKLPLNLPTVHPMYKPRWLSRPVSDTSSPTPTMYFQEAGPSSPPWVSRNPSLVPNGATVQLPVLHEMSMLPPLLQLPELSDTSLPAPTTYLPEAGPSSPPWVSRKPSLEPNGATVQLPVLHEMSMLPPLLQLPELSDPSLPTPTMNFQEAGSSSPPLVSRNPSLEPNGATVQLPVLHEMSMLPPLLQLPELSVPSLPTPPMNFQEAGPSSPPWVSRNPPLAPREGKSATVPAPFPWATTYRAIVHSLKYLLFNQIFFINGEVQCMHCKTCYNIMFDLQSKFVEVQTFIGENKSTMHDRAPAVWMSPLLQTCIFCLQENSVIPNISCKKRRINWLFLFLGQILGCCTPEQLKYFCKHTKNHQTGEKDHLLYLTYLGLCKQLNPSGSFESWPFPPVLGEGKSATVPAPFPWATTRRATVHSLNYLLSKQILSIPGQVQCMRCDHRYEMEFDLISKFVEIQIFIADNKSAMHGRAPAVWMSPVLPTCEFCSQENSVMPIIYPKKKMINWLFLFLGQILGCCTLEQLNYFCKHNKIYPTDEKDRVLYLTYLGLGKQIDPSGPFEYGLSQPALWEGKSATVPAPFPWATTHRATVHRLNYLLKNQIFSIPGQVQCTRCDHRYEMEFDLLSKFVEIKIFIADNKSAMHGRAPAVWMSPLLPTCWFCSQENSVIPIIYHKKKMINWLFLFLGQILGCCTLEQLNYFCKHTMNHQTGEKDRVLYLTYLGLCKQLDPNGPFEV